MRRLVWATLLLLAGTLGVRAAEPVSTEQPGARTLEQADRLYSAGKFADAALAYQRLLATRKVPRTLRDDRELRFAMALGKSGEWDRALQVSVDFVRRHQRTIWEPRGLHWLGRLYLYVPHTGFRKDGRFFRNATPEYVDAEGRPAEFVEADDQRHSLQAFEAAQILFSRLERGSGQKELSEDEIQLDFDLARSLAGSRALITWARGHRWDPPGDPSWDVDPSGAYSLDWPVAKKEHYLYARVRALAGVVRSAHLRVLGLFGEALWLDGYHHLMERATMHWEDGRQVWLLYPYETDSPERLLHRALDDAPGDTSRGQIQITLSQLLSGRGERAEAERVLQDLLAGNPGEPWRGNAQAELLFMHEPEFLAYAVSPCLPDAPKTIRFSHRNICSVHVEVDAVDLSAAILTNKLTPAHLDFDGLFGTPESARKFYREHVGTFDLPAPDRMYPYLTDGTFEVPVHDPGAYVVELSAGARKSRVLLQVTDIALLTRPSKDGWLQFAVDRRSGQPIASAQIYTRQFWSEGSRSESADAHGVSGPDGTHEVPLARPAHHTNLLTLVRKADRVLAAIDGSSQAVVPEEAPVYVDSVGAEQSSAPQTQAGLQAYTVTDRTLYRPGEVVHAREILLQRSESEWRPAANRSARLEIIDPTRERVVVSTFRTDSFGCAPAEITLPSEAKLGWHVLELVLLQSGGAGPELRLNAGAVRVEEPRVPEFEVRIEAPSHRLRPGDHASLRITASYYSGEPVPDAPVHYRIFRSQFWPQIDFPEASELPGRAEPQPEPSPNGPIYAQGDARTTTDGRVTVPITTAPDPPDGGGADWEYVVLVDVLGAGRRTVSQTAVLPVPRDQLRLLLSPQRGYFREGEPVKVRVFTADPGGQPVAASAHARLERVPSNPERGPSGSTPDNRTRIAVSDEPLLTGADGLTDWSAPSLPGGLYQLTVTATHASGAQVEQSVRLWVLGGETTRWGTTLSGREVVLLARELRYRAGEAASVMLAIPEPGAVVLVTREDGERILERRVVRIEKAVAELSFPLTSRDEPDVFVTASVLLRERFNTKEVRIHVPVVERLARVDVRPERSRYAPGESARIHLVARDFSGRPLRGRVSLAATDSALDAIQSRTSSHIWAYYHGYERENRNPTRMFEEEIGASHTYPSQPPRPNPYEWLYPDDMGRIGDFPSDVWTRRYLRAIERDLGRAYWWEEGLGGMDGGMGGSMGGGIFGGTSPSGPPLPVIRRSFAETAFWASEIDTGTDGSACVEVRWPSNLTRWRLRAVVVASGGEVGEGEARVTTAKDLSLRLEAPRFLLERDRSTLTAVLRNELPYAQQVAVTFRIQPPPPGTQPPAEVRADLAPGAEQRIEIPIRATTPGSLRVSATVRGDLASDGEERAIPVLTHGVEQIVTRAGVLEQDRDVKLRLPFPADRRPGTGELVVQLEPTLLGVALDALPFLAGYPYGCTEQTMSRFMPAVMLHKTLQEAGWDLEALAKRVRALQARERQDRAEIAGGAIPDSPYTAPGGRLGTPHLPPGSDEPVLDSARLQAMTRQGMESLALRQHEDGGWGWWIEGSSDWYLSGYVFSGLLAAREAGVEVPTERLHRAADYLQKQLDATPELRTRAYLASVLVEEPGSRSAVQGLLAGALFEGREQLDPQNQARLARALSLLGDSTRAQAVLRTLEQTVRTDHEAGTAHWEVSQLESSRWYGDPVETNAAVVEAYLSAEPRHPVLPGLVRWLVSYRRGATWRSTRETAAAVTALSHYTRVTGQLAPDYTVRVRIGSRLVRELHVTPGVLPLFDGRIVVPERELPSGSIPLVIEKTNGSALYYSASVRAFSRESSFGPYGGDLRVQRRYTRLVPLPPPAVQIAASAAEKNPFLVRHYADLGPEGMGGGDHEDAAAEGFRRAPLRPGDTVHSGDTIEVELDLEARSDFDYLLFEDPRAGGWEPVDLHSGEVATGGVVSRMELRDFKVAFFLGHLPAGRTVLRYRARAEGPGDYDVLPTAGYAMYAPDLAAGSGGCRLRVRASR